MLFATQHHNTSNLEVDANGGATTKLENEILDKFVTQNELQSKLAEKTNIKMHEI